ncbi:hypothetical protein AN2351V1_1029 [Citrobacter koseri]|nr:hypothetical protein AN2351V1_1029 [Citrobacter koseri]CAH5988286.1 hypothetical protein AN2351V1_1029 [Citrobacter koseri]
MDEKLCQRTSQQTLPELNFGENFSNNTVTHCEDNRKDDVCYTNPVKHMPGKGVDGSVRISKPHPVTKENIRGIQEITGTVNLPGSPD